MDILEFRRFLSLFVTFAGTFSMILSFAAFGFLVFRRFVMVKVRASKESLRAKCTCAILDLLFSNKNEDLVLIIKNLKRSETDLVKDLILEMALHFSSSHKKILLDLYVEFGFLNSDIKLLQCGNIIEKVSVMARLHHFPMQKIFIPLIRGAYEKSLILHMSCVRYIVASGLSQTIDLEKEIDMFKFGKRYDLCREFLHLLLQVDRLEWTRLLNKENDIPTVSIFADVALNNKFLESADIFVEKIKSLDDGQEHDAFFVNKIVDASVSNVSLLDEEAIADLCSHGDSDIADYGARAIVTKIPQLKNSVDNIMRIRRLSLVKGIAA